MRPMRHLMWAPITRVARTLRSEVGRAEVVGLVGYAATLYGIWQMHPPSAWVIGGLVPLTMSIMGAFNARPRNGP
jgi:hypothetical protein